MPHLTRFHEFLTAGKVNKSKPWKSEDWKTLAEPTSAHLSFYFCRQFSCPLSGRCTPFRQKIVQASLHQCRTKALRQTILCSPWACLDPVIEVGVASHAYITHNIVTLMVASFGSIYLEDTCRKRLLVS